MNFKKGPVQKQAHKPNWHLGEIRSDVVHEAKLEDSKEEIGLIFEGVC